MLSMNGKHHCHPQRGLSAARSATRAAARASEQLPCSSRARDATAGEQHRTANRDAGLLQGTTAWSRRSAANPARRRAAAASGARRRARERTAAVREPLPCARRDGLLPGRNTSVQRRAAAAVQHHGRRERYWRRSLSTFRLHWQGPLRADSRAACGGAVEATASCRGYRQR